MPLHVLIRINIVILLVDIFGNTEPIRWQSARAQRESWRHRVKKPLGLPAGFTSMFSCISSFSGMARAESSALSRCTGSWS